MTSDRTLMLNLYRSVYHFIGCLRAADRVCETKGDIRFVMCIRWRYIHKADRMKMTMQEHQRLTALAIKGGWNGTAIKDDQLEETTA
ncbi:MAG TPA: hypothetical protein VK832_03090 [Burkholderiaceae bacterium]|jgi:hypothetical protein|nr:hypothetical protein [Burkholderiaceae bacterium]